MNLSIPTSLFWKVLFPLGLHNIPHLDQHLRQPAHRDNFIVDCVHSHLTLIQSNNFSRNLLFLSVVLVWRSVLRPHPKVPYPLRTLLLYLPPIRVRWPVRLSLTYLMQLHQVPPSWDPAEIRDDPPWAIAFLNVPCVMGLEIVQMPEMKVQLNVANLVLVSNSCGVQFIAVYISDFPGDYFLCCRDPDYSAFSRSDRPSNIDNRIRRKYLLPVRIPIIE